MKTQFFVKGIFRYFNKQTEAGFILEPFRRLNPTCTNNFVPAHKSLGHVGNYAPATICKLRLPPSPKGFLLHFIAARQGGETRVLHHILIF
jgi:hypothetical protein